MWRCWGVAWPGPGHEPLPSKSLCGCIQLGLQGTDAGKVISELSSSALSLLRKTWVELALHFVSQCSELLIYASLLSTGIGELIGRCALGSEGLIRSTCSCSFLEDSILLHIQTDPGSDLSSPVSQVGFPGGAEMQVGMQDVCMESTPVILRQKDWAGEKVNLG